MELKKCRISDIINIKEWEVRISFLSTIIFIVFFYVMDFYSQFIAFQGCISEVIICLLGAMFGLLGFSLSGLAFLTTLFSKKEIKLIEKINGKGVVKQLLSSYSFLSVNIAIQILVLLVIYVLLASNKNLICEGLFWSIVGIELYHINFILFYTVALIYNCVKMYSIKNNYQDVIENEKNFYIRVNEIRIDYILSILSNIHGFSLDEIKEDIIRVINDSTIEEEEKNKIIRYIKSQYEK